MELAKKLGVLKEGIPNVKLFKSHVPMAINSGDVISEKNSASVQLQVFHHG